MPTVLRHSKSNMRSLLLSVTPSSTVLLAENSLSDNRGANGKPTSNLLENQGNWWQTVIPVTIQMSVESTQMVSTALLKFQNFSVWKITKIKQNWWYWWVWGSICKNNNKIARTLQEKGMNKKSTHVTGFLQISKHTQEASHGFVPAALQQLWLQMQT